MANDLEMRDAILPPFYLYSLLYCVAGLLEDKVDYPLVGMQRYYSSAAPFGPVEFPEIKRVLDRAAAYPHPWVWSESAAGPGLNSRSRSHGGFDEETDTLASLAVLIQKGGV